MHPITPAGGWLLILILGPGLLIAAFIGHRFGRIRAERFVRRPSLTPIGTRYAFMQETETLLARDLPGSLALILVDVAGLRVTNRQCGHEAGDELLSILASRLAANGASVYRVDGDEFALIIDRTKGESVTSILSNLEPFDSRFESCGHEHRISCSYGYASCRKGETFESLFARAESLIHAFRQRLDDSSPTVGREPEPVLATITSLAAVRKARSEAVLSIPF